MGLKLMGARWMNYGGGTKPNRGAARLDVGVKGETGTVGPDQELQGKGLSAPSSRVRLPRGI